MPAASYSSSVSWGVYVASSLMLVAICSPALEVVKTEAYGRSAADTAAGAALLFDSLAPGTVLTFSFHSPASGGRMELMGRNVTVEWGGRTSTHETARLLPNQTLEPDVQYGLQVVGDRLEVFGLVGN